MRAVYVRYANLGCGRLAAGVSAPVSSVSHTVDQSKLIQAVSDEVLRAPPLYGMEWLTSMLLDDAYFAPSCVKHAVRAAIDSGFSGSAFASTLDCTAIMKPLDNFFLNYGLQLDEFR